MNRAGLIAAVGMSLAMGLARPEPLPVERYCEGHPVQEAFLADHSRVRVLICGRRTGKTVVFAVLAAREAQKGDPGQWVVYITRTRKNAKKQVWPWVKRILRESDIPHKVNESDLSIEIEGAAGIMLGGADTVADIEKYRGFALVGAIVDECGIYPSHLLEVLMDEVLEPATIDTGGWMVFGGTPGYVLTGRWYQISGPHMGTANGASGPEYDPEAANCPVYRGNLRSNPHLMSKLPPEERAAAVEAILEDVRQRNGWDESHPTYVREWLGLWAQDDEALVFPLAANRNDYPGAGHDLGDGPFGLPSHSTTGIRLAVADWRIVIGVDVGFTAANAYAVVATHPSLTRSFVLRTFKRREQFIPEMGRELRKLREDFAISWHGRRYQPSVVIDAGGMGKIHAATLSAKLGVPVKPADKREKGSSIAVTRDEVKSGRIAVLRLDQWGEDPNAALADEWHVLVWNEKRDGIADDQEDHATDAVLYALRDLRDFTRKEPPNKPKKGTPEWHARKEAEEIEALERAEANSGRRRRRRRLS